MKCLIIESCEGCPYCEMGSIGYFCFMSLFPVADKSIIDPKCQLQDLEIEEE